MATSTLKTEDVTQNSDYTSMDTDVSISIPNSNDNPIMPRDANPVPRGIIPWIAFNNQSTSLMQAISINKKFIMLMHETRIFYFGSKSNQRVKQSDIGINGWTIEEIVEFKKLTEDLTNSIIGTYLAYVLSTSKTNTLLFIQICAELLK